MNYSADHNALNNKRDELVDVAYSILRSDELASQLVDSLCRFSPPQDPPRVIEMITVHSMGASGGRSRKPGNIVVNFRSLIGDFGDIGLAAGAGATDKSLIPLAAMAIWIKIWNRSKIKLTQEQASLVYAMWLNREPENLISSEEASAMYKLICINQGRPEPSDESFNEALSALVSFGSIAWHKSGKIWLREWVRNVYS